MKFFAYAALIATAATIRLAQKAAVHNAAEKHVPSPEEVWSHFDTNHDNKWDLKEAQGAFKGAMEYFGHDLPKGWKKMVKKEFKKADKDNSGAVDPKEMGVYLFKLVDENEDGEIQIEELYGAIEAIAEFSGNTLIDGWKEKTLDAVKGVDTDKSGGASMSEIMKALEENGFPDINDLFVPKEGEKINLKSLLKLALGKNGKAVPDPEEVWKHFDKNGDGEWSLAEAQAAIRAGLEHFGHDVPADIDEQVAKHFKEVDADGSGKVSPKEMGAWIFDLVDSDDDGEIQLDELNHAIEEIAKFTGNTLKQGWKKMVKDAVSGVDTDRSGGASMKEIMAALKKHGVPNINDLFEGH